MGAYGSPEFIPSQRPQNYSYGTHYQNYEKPKKHWGKLFVGFALGVAFCFTAYGFAIAHQGRSAQMMNSIPSYSAPELVSSASVPVYSAPKPLNDQNHYLQAWSKVAVEKSLLYPDAAEFSEETSDWSCIQDGNICTVSSCVTALDSEKHSFSLPFVVKFSYSELQAKVVYISVGSRVTYDLQSKSK